MLRLSESYHRIAGQHINEKEGGGDWNLQEPSGLACLNELSARVSRVAAARLMIPLQPCQLVRAGFHFIFIFPRGREKLLLRTLWVFQCYSFKKKFHSVGHTYLLILRTEIRALSLYIVKSLRLCDCKRLQFILIFFKCLLLSSCSSALDFISISWIIKSPRR